MAQSQSPEYAPGTPTDLQTPESFIDVDLNMSLEDLQTEEQRAILDMIVNLRKCGLNGTLSLPQIVVCGDQSAGKSSVLEALTGIPFPRNDNLCTRFATEISLRRANLHALTIKVNPDESRPAAEKEKIKAFEETITNLDDLPHVMDLAMIAMGISNGEDKSIKLRAFARDVLSIEICGPNQPQLTLVDIPGLIATSTRGVTKADVDMVTEITDYYIQQSRTICLAVVSATNDYANQKILEKVRDVDPEGERTLGIITKPDGLAPNSGSETAFIELAQNKDIFFTLGWHVLKNRKFEETAFSLEERNLSECAFFRTSNFKVLPDDCVGIDSLRRRLSILLFEHIKRELPKLREDLEQQLDAAEEQLETMGRARSTAAECKAYLAELSLEIYETSKAAINGHYESSYFQHDLDTGFSLTSPATLSRTRAVVQTLNAEFAESIRLNGHKYQINTSDEEDPIGFSPVIKGGPQKLSKKQGLEWVRKVLLRTRGKELLGNFNPLLIGELFWEQSSNWEKLSRNHIDAISNVCSRFLKSLLQSKCPSDVESRIWALKIEDMLKARHRAALAELQELLKDLREYPINYNHYYTDTITKRRQERQRKAIEQAVEEATSTTWNDSANHHAHTTRVDIEKVMASYSKSIDPNMDQFSCEEAIDCLLAIYKVNQKTFVANVTVQVIERHIVRDLEKIFSPVVVNELEPASAEALASEPAAAKSRREHLETMIKSLQDGRDIFRSVM